MKTKNTVWKSADGRQTLLSDMETDHLHNLVTYLFRRMEEAERLAQHAFEMGRILPPAQAQGHPLKDWVDAGIKELSKREKKEYVKSMNKVLSSPLFVPGDQMAARLLKSKKEA